MYIISISSEKGGVGKSCLAHALAYGASLVEQDPDFGIIIGHTDKRDPIKFGPDRGYAVIDIRDPAKGVTVLKKAFTEEKAGLLIIDLGANMGDYSDIIAKGSHLVIVPVLHDFDSLREATAIYEKHQNTMFVTNQTPAPYSREYIKFSEQILSNLPSERVLFKMPSARAIADFGRPEPLTSYVKSRLRAPSIDFYRSVKADIERLKS